LRIGKRIGILNQCVKLKGEYIKLKGQHFAAEPAKLVA
jgi:hypothetical protein